MSGCQALRFEAVSKGKLTIPKDLVTQSSEGLVRLTVYNQHFLVGLKTKESRSFHEKPQLSGAF